MAFVSPSITAFAVEATEFEILGALPQNAFIQQALAQVSPPAREPEPQTKP
jgi:hypothetical protein